MKTTVLFILLALSSNVQAHGIDRQELIDAVLDRVGRCINPPPTSTAYQYRRPDGVVIFSGSPLAPPYVLVKKMELDWGGVSEDCEWLHKKR